MPASTPDTAAYLVLGLVVFFGILALFVVTMVIRANNLRKDEALIEQLGEEK
jgi:hypothetical protein